MFQIANDVHEVESIVVDELKDEIDDVAAVVKDSLPEKAKKIRDSVVEEYTGQKLVRDLSSYSSKITLDCHRLFDVQFTHYQSQPPL
jgi:hypothetical protein